MTKSIELKVAEALQQDVGRGIVRIDSRAREALGVSTGDIVELKGKRSTAAIVWQAHPQDEGMSIVRMDGYLRQNTGVALQDRIMVKKAETVEAKKVVLAPMQPIKYSPGFDQFVLKRLIGRALTKGDMIFVGVFGTSFPLIAALVQPSGMAMITDRTELVLKEEPIKKTGTGLTLSYEDVGGLKEEVRKIREMVELPMRHPELFEKLGIEAPKGVLIYGPPGTGKTLLAKAVASESEANFIHIGGPELVSKFVGESEEKLRQLFKDAEENAPSIIFMDELDAIAPKREEVTGEVEKRMVSQLLTLMDGLKARGQVIVIGATNRVNSIDPALRRPGRFDREIEIGVPDRKSRLEILQIHTRGMPLENDVNLEELSGITHGYTGADISSLTKEAAMKTLRRILPQINLEQDTIPPEILENLRVTREDFFNALREILPSALREVFLERPNVHWGDMGGMEKVKEEMKEAIELPLKRPEIFSKFGIRPIKGILLVGLPGTGKTMIAKAVATETEANFISIKGPEVLCLAPGTPIFTDNCGLREISEFYERIKDKTTVERATDSLEVRKLNEPVFTFGIGKNGQIEKTKIERMHRVFVPKSYEIALSNGTALTVSENQPFYAYADGEIRWVKTSELKEGSWIAVPAQIPAFAKEMTIAPPSDEHLRMVQENEEFAEMRVFSARETARLPKKLSEDLAEFLGWFVAEGNISKEGISIANADKENKGRIKKLFGLFVPAERIREYSDKTVVYSTPLVHYLEGIFEMFLRRKKSGIIGVPSIIFKSDCRRIARFLRGAYLGDGHLGKTKVEYGTMSKKLAHGITYLLSILGIKYRRWERKDRMWMITISGKKEISAFKSAVFGEEAGKVRRYYNARYHIPDVSALLREAKSALNLKYDKEIPEGLFEGVLSGRKRCGLIRLQRMMSYLEKYADEKFRKSRCCASLSLMSKGTLAWIRVEKKTAGGQMWMYDLETENSSFIGGELPTVLHNSKWVGESEKAVREIFRKARTAAPCIIFIDEIDAVGSWRGVADDAGGRVRESVVNTFLTEMDGLTNLKNVVVIAATNRPDILDPGLLRAGRFDKIIEMTVPDEKTRHEIFKVHTKKMPLAKDVDLEELSKKTEENTGADIENICREAGMHAIRENPEGASVEMKHFLSAMKSIRPTVTKAHVESMKKFAKQDAMFR